MRIISLGWGVQSWALAAMSALGVLPKATAVFSDTGWEHPETLEFKERWTPWLEEHGVPVHTTGPLGKSANVVVLGPTSTALNVPAFLRKPDGKKAGPLRKQCYAHWKIRPLRRKFQELRGKETVELWLGFSADESKRAKPSRLKYIINRLPFLDDFNPPMTRDDIIEWLVKNNLEVPMRSSCIICPFHAKDEWLRLRDKGGETWGRIIAVDEEIRNIRPDYTCYLHRNRVPIKDL